MIRVYQAENNELMLVENYPANWTLKDVVNEQRRLWNEGEGRLVFVIMDDKRNILATMLKCEDDPEIAITVDARTGTVIRHRCRYLVDSEGFYEGTEITLL